MTTIRKLVFLAGLLLGVSLLLVLPTSSGPLSEPKRYDAVLRNEKVDPELHNLFVSHFKDSPDAWQLVQDKETNEQIQKEFAPMWNWFESEGIDVHTLRDRSDVAAFENPFYLLPSGKPLQVRGMVAKRPIQAGEELFLIPQRLFISSDTVLGHPILGRHLVSTDDPQDQRRMIVIWLLYESWPSNSRNSRWRPFLDTLPSMEESRQDWSAPEFLNEHLPGDWPLKSTLSENQRKNLMVYEIGVRSFFDSIAEQYSIPKELYSLERFLWARFLLASRIYATSSNLEKGIALIPFADLFNHMNNHAIWLFDSQLNGYRALTTRSYSAGQQIYCHYSDSSNAHLLSYYGFLIPKNIYEWAPLNLTLPPTTTSVSGIHQKLLTSISSTTHTIYPDAMDRRLGQSLIIRAARVLALSSEAFPGIQLNNSLFDMSFEDHFFSFDVELATVRIVINALNTAIASWASSLEEDAELLNKPMPVNSRNLVLYRWWDKQIIVAFRDQMLQLQSQLSDPVERNKFVFGSRVLYHETIKPIISWLQLKQFEQIRDKCAEKKFHEEDSQSASREACNIVLDYLISEMEFQGSMTIRQSVVEQQPLAIMQQHAFLKDLHKRGIPVNSTLWLLGELTDNPLWADPISLAVVQGLVDTLYYLLEMGADPNMRSWEGVSLVHYACSMNNDKVLQVLLSHGADINAPSAIDGKTCLDVAKSRNNRKILRFLGEYTIGEHFYEILLPAEKMIEQNLLVAFLTTLFIGFVTGMALDSRKRRKKKSE